MKLKPIAELAAGDWVLLESMILSRHVTRPWEVVSISKTRVTIQRGRVDPVTKEPYISESKYIYVKTILFVFAKECEADAAFEFALKNSDVYEKAARELRVRHDKVFDDYMGSLL